jgi:hypothetical protein
MVLDLEDRTEHLADGHGKRDLGAQKVAVVGSLRASTLDRITEARLAEIHLCDRYLSENEGQIL